MKDENGVPKKFTWKQIMDVLGDLALPTHKIMLVRSKLMHKDMHDKMVIRKNRN
tara:strand:- start:1360 stop:1521 length:162 start_codon:yes stop_codon:yes gene_type:complete